MAVQENVQVNPKLDWNLMLRPGMFNRDQSKERAQQWVDRANNLEAQIAVRRDEILRNPNLSDKGKTAAIEELRRSMRPQLNAFREAADSMTEALARSEANMTDPEPAGDPVILEMRAREIRDHYRGADTGAVYRAISEAAERSDWETLHALQGAPVSIPMGDPAVFERMRRERIKELFPDLMARAEDQETLRDLLVQMAEQLSRRIEE